MDEVCKVKLTNGGDGQTLTLPAGFQFESDEVYVSRNENSKDVTLSTQLGAKVWEEFFAFRDSIDMPDDWMMDRPMNGIWPDREPPLFREKE